MQKDQRLTIQVKIKQPLLWRNTIFNCYIGHSVDSFCLSPWWKVQLSFTEGLNRHMLQWLSPQSSILSRFPLVGYAVLPSPQQTDLLVLSYLWRRFISSKLCFTIICLSKYLLEWLTKFKQFRTKVFGWYWEKDDKAQEARRIWNITLHCSALDEIKLKRTFFKDQTLLT